MKRMSLLVAAALFFGTSAAVANEQSFHVNGFNVLVYYEQKNNILDVSGEVTDGPDCGQLNIEIFFRNSSDSGIAHITTAISSYNTISPHAFYGQDRVSSDRKYRSDWFVSSIYVKCM